MTQDVYGHYRVTGTLDVYRWPGEVVRGEHTTQGTPGAIRIIRIGHTRASLERWLAEVAFEHPGFARVLDRGLLLRHQDDDVADDHDAFVVTELLAGEDVAQRVYRGRLEVALAVDVAQQAARALARAHACGIVHGDLTADTVFLATDGASPVRVVICDLGIGRIVVGPRTQCLAGWGRHEFNTLSPEQALGQPPDARSDIYALGAVLFHMLHGRPLFRDADVPGMQQLVSILQEEPPDLRTIVPGIPARLAELVQQLLAKDPARRPQSMDEVALILAELA